MIRPTMPCVSAVFPLEEPLLSVSVRPAPFRFSASKFLISGCGAAVNSSLQSGASDLIVIEEKAPVQPKGVAPASV